jgi:hypothetical protein
MWGGSASGKPISYGVQWIVGPAAGPHRFVESGRQPNQIAALSAPNSQALVAAVARIYQQFLGAKKVQTGAVIPTFFIGLGGVGSRIVDHIAGRASRLPNCRGSAARDGRSRPRASR